MRFFKKAKFEDERLTNIKNKIYAEVYILMIVFLSISIVLKYFIYNLGAQSIATELIILFVSGIYSAYRSTKLGLFSAEIEMHDRKSKWSRQKKNLFVSIIFGVSIALFFGINSAVQYADGTLQSIHYFLLTTLVSLMMYLPFFLIFFVLGNEVLKKNSENSINKMLDDESGDSDEKH